MTPTNETSELAPCLPVIQQAPPQTLPPNPCPDSVYKLATDQGLYLDQQMQHKNSPPAREGEDETLGFLEVDGHRERDLEVNGHKER